MIFFLTITTIVKFFAISLGVGASTLAVANFFVAIADGVIDENERRMMGMVYVVLRIALTFVLVTTLLLLGYEYSRVGFAALSAFSLGQVTVIFVLLLNTLLMTAQLVSTTFGPAVQVGSWYTLGGLVALDVLGLIHFSYTQFVLSYLSWIILVIGIVNGIMAAIKARNEQKSAY